MSNVTDVAQIPEAFKVKTTHYLLGGLSLVVALSWNDTIKHSIKKVYPLPDDQVLPSIIYSFVITMLLILVVFMLPDTTTELPLKTQEKVRQVETTDRINGLESKVDNLVTENENLKQERAIIIERMSNVI